MNYKKKNANSFCNFIFPPVVFAVHTVVTILRNDFDVPLFYFSVTVYNDAVFMCLVRVCETGLDLVKLLTDVRNIPSED